MTDILWHYWFYAYASWSVLHNLSSLVTDGTCSISSLSPSTTFLLLSHFITTGKILAALKLGFRLCQMNMTMVRLRLPSSWSTHSLRFVMDCSVPISSLSQMFCHGRLNSLSHTLLHNLFITQRPVQLFLMSGPPPFPSTGCIVMAYVGTTEKIIIK
jgi:hypothetical protein